MWCLLGGLTEVWGGTVSVSWHPEGECILYVVCMRVWIMQRGLSQEADAIALA